MDGKQYFRNCCQKAGVDCGRLFWIGKSSAKSSNRLIYYSPYLHRKETQLFVVCYFELENVYIAWSLKEDKANKKSSFSIKRSDIGLPLGNGIVPVEKAIEYLGWGEETVLAFSPEQVFEFLKRYCGGTT